MNPIHRFFHMLPQRYSLDFAGDSPLMILGSGRSGTTWLAELCNYRNDFRYIFEPLNPDTNHRAKKMLSWAPEPNDSCPQLEAFIRGKDSPSWSFRYNRRFLTQRRLIKEIRLNLAIPWLQNHFPQATLVKLVRNPVDVAISRQRLDRLGDQSSWVWKPSLSELLNEPNILNALSTTQKEALSDCVGAGVIMETIADWCISNMIFSLDTFTVHYESLVTEPEATLRRIFEYAGIVYSADVLALVAKSSSTTRTTDGSKEAHSPNDAALLSEEQLDRIKAVLDCFEVERFYTANWAPVN